ncbi:MAG: helicase, partial [Clostridia bacterium]
VIIDEMQDYGLMAFVIMNKMFNCPKTVLGDIFQSIERKVEKEFLSDLTKLFGENTVLLDLKKSYRSTMEIAKFAQGFLEQCNAENVSRHGAEPQKIASENFDDMILQIKNKLSDKSSQKYTRRAIITKTDEEAKKIAIALEKVCEVSLIEMSSQQIPEGNIVISAPVSKGLEFDLVIVPNYDNINYKTEIDKNSLYISCTRALHELMLCYFGQECELNSFKESKI